MGSLTSMLMHTLFNVNVTINNLIVKLAAGGTMATLTCKSIMACTPDDGWQRELEVLPALLCCLKSIFKLELLPADRPHSSLCVLPMLHVTQLLSGRKSTQNLLRKALLLYKQWMHVVMMQL